MKINNAFFFFFFFLCGFTIAEFIYDSNGDILNNGGTYYILSPGSESVAIIKGTSISTSSKSSSSSCSIAVVAVESDDNGWATKIATTFPLNHITNDYPLNISFPTLPSTTCTNTSSWIVTHVGGFLEDTVMVGNFQEFAVPRNGYFYIKPADKSSTDENYYYKFAFCYSKASCGYVTLKIDSDDNIRLVVTKNRSEQPFAFKFVKATREDVASGISMVV